MNTSNTSTNTSTSNLPELSESIARTVLQTVDAGLVSGIGKPIPGQMCVEAAVCFAYGLPHSDNPPCVGSAVRKYKIRLNDANWSSDEARTQGMRKLAIAQLGSDILDQKEFTQKLAFRTITELLSTFLIGRGFMKKGENCKKAQNLSDAASAASYAASAADAAAYAAASYAASAADAAAYAADAASASAADAAAYAADAASAASNSDKYLNFSAEIALSIFQEMNSPGCAYLYLCEEQN